MGVIVGVVADNVGVTIGTAVVVEVGIRCVAHDDDAIGEFELLHAFMLKIV